MTSGDKPRGAGATDDALVSDVASSEPASAGDDLEGVSLGPYRVVDKLGQGGMGVVYRAQDTRLAREVALKVLPAATAGDQERRSRFLREARSTAAVNHPNIATVHDVGEEGGRVYLAMELIEGTTLRRRLAMGPFEQPEALRIAREIASGLARAHARGIVHRDLKPENVMLTREGGVKILDFGLAKLHEPPSTDTALGHQETQTQEGRVMGTPGYMSPEQAEGKPVDPRTDVFAFGVVLHEMLTGELPGVYSGAKAPADPAVGALIARCLARAPEQRWGDASQLLLALDDLERRRPAPPRPRSRRGLLVASLAVLAAAGVVVTWWSRRAAPDAVTAAAPASPAAPRPTTLADLPMPATTVPEARTEYAAGMQLLRDDSFDVAMLRFKRAAELDPSMASAHLRYAIAGSISGDAADRRAAFARAAALRGTLTDRERMLLEVFEPQIGRSKPDLTEAIRRMQEAHDRAPYDEELLVRLAELTVGDPARGIPAARLATELDPADAFAWELLGRGLAAEGELADSRAALQRCAGISVESADCLHWLARLDGVAGRCEDMETEATRHADLEPSHGYANLADAMVALGRPRPALRVVLDRQLQATPPDARPFRSSIYDAELATLDGRFDRARDALGQASRALAAVPAARVSLLRNLQLATARTALLAETGDAAGARAAAADFVGRLDGMTRGSLRTAADSDRWSLAGLAGVPLASTRATWIAETTGASLPGCVQWTAAWAKAAQTPEDARAAIAALDGDGRLAPPKGGEVVWALTDADAATGHAFLLAGRPADALPYLRRASRNCFVLDQPYARLHASLDLGNALEQTGDGPGACAAYAVVLASWGSAVPRSVSAEAARSGMKRLACPRSP